MLLTFADHQRETEPICCPSIGIGRALIETQSDLDLRDINQIDE